MKKLLLPLLLAFGFFANAQTYNNEWINYSRTYYKFKVGSTGLYRISQPVLAGIGIGGTPAEQFQLWRNGEQIPLYTTVATGTMGAGDYIEFWGERNDGKPDNILYRDPDYQINDKWSLETDTAAFFLTVNPTGGNFRYVNTASILPSSVPVEPYFIHTEGRYYKEDVHRGFGNYINEYVYSSAYDKGEGISSAEINGAGGMRPENLTNLFPYTGAGAPPASMKVYAAGNNVFLRQFEVKVNGTQVALETMDFFDYKKAEFPVTNSLFAGGTANVEIKNLCTDVNGRMRLGKTELIYPRQFNFGNTDRFIFELSPSTNPSGNYLEISGFNFSGLAPVLYDMTNMKRYVGDISSGTLVKIALAPSSVKRTLLLISQQSSIPQQITALQQRNFVNYAAAANQGNYLIIANPVLLTSTAGANPVEDYRAYRSSTAGGNHTAKTYMIDQLVDQFGFGIKQHPSSIRNFIRYARTAFSSPVKNVLIVGKGVTYYTIRKGIIDNQISESDPNIAKLALVPTFGEPGSDWLLTSEPGPDQTPKVSIGRISAINGDEVADYLAKVKQYEQQQAFLSPLISDKAWMKNAVNVVGARDIVLSNTLTNYLLGYKNILSDTLYGASVHTFSKSTAATVEQASSEKLTALFQEGLGLLTYFGHSSASTLEFNLDDPAAYNNSGKYPLFMLLGCNAGNFFTFNGARFITKETISEKYVLAPQRGTIATIASTHFGIAHYLDIYNTMFVNAASTTHYGKTMGEIMQETMKNVFALTTQNDFYARFHCEQATLHGDPAIRMDAEWAKPDYVIEDQLLKVTPTIITTAENSFTVKASFMNMGKAINKPIVIEAKRTYPNNVTVVVRRDTIPGIRYMDSLTYIMDIIPTRDLGLTKLSFCIDADNAVDELFESNNCITKDIFITDNDIKPVYPYNYAIINTQGIKLVASTANAFSPSRQYVMEMDTTQLFNSPFKLSRNTTSVGGVLEFSTGITFTDSTVYYWRVAPVPVSGQPIWNGFSFVYLQNSDKGFNQSHYYQHEVSAKDKIFIDGQTKAWRYDSVANNLFIRNGVWFTATTQEADLSISVNNNSLMRNTCIYGLTFNVFDGKSFIPWVNTGGQYGSYGPVCAPSRRWNFEFTNDLSGRNKARDFLRTAVQNGNYVVVRNIPTSTANEYVSNWIADRTAPGNSIGNTLYDELISRGITVIDSLTSPRVFNAVYKKGDLGFAPVQQLSVGKFDVISTSVNCKTPDSTGTIMSPVYGPAKVWRQLKWRGTSDHINDTALVNVIGVATNGVENTLFSNLTTSQQDFDISSINAAAYPFLKLKMFAKDGQNFSPYQLRYWRVTYDPIPEGAIAPNIYFSATRDTVELGEPPINYQIAFKNISEVPFDSVKVKMVYTDRNNVPHIVPQSRRRPLPVNDTIRFGGTIPTNSIPGLNTILFEANPDGDQIEQFHFNNLAFKTLYVKPDSLNPLLDVTFDGVHILNGDIVSSKPDIVIKLKDEAKWMILDDTSLLTLSLRNPLPPEGDGRLRRFYFNNDTLRFIPAGQAPNNDNTATVNFSPQLLKDGKYELIITGKDKSNNQAGTIEYRVEFKVLNKPMISNMLNYPNPFTTSTAFVFTVTGNEVPQNIKIEIMTITGKIVREITKDELGPLHIGRNITDFKWDGTDQYGGKLANGVYLYRVVTNLNGKSLDKYTADGDKTDQFFNKGYGKMYLMR
jgi:Peptidase family C25